MLKLINNISVKNKLIITYFIVVILPILIIGYFLTNKLYMLSFSNTKEISSATLQQISGNYLHQLESCKSVLDGLVTYKPLVDYIETRYGSDYEAIDDFNSKISPFIRRLRDDAGDVRIRVFSDNPTIRHSIETSNALEDLSRQEWFGGMSQSAAGTVTWTTAANLESRSPRKYFGCYRLLRSLDAPNTFSSIVSVFFNESQLYSLISEEKEAGKVIFLCDQNGKILTTTERTTLFGDIGDLVFNKKDTLSDLSNASLIQYQGNEYLFFRTTLNDSRLFIHGWSLIYLVPADDMLLGIRNIWTSSLLLCLVCMLIALTLILFVSKNITGRVQGLIRKIRSSISDNFQTEAVISGSDEIGVLENNFFEMQHKIRDLIEEVYVSDLKIKDGELSYHKIQTEKRKAEIIALQSQINPHYLFNTLETIRMSLVLNNDKKNADILAAFAESFRQCIDNETDIHTIREELVFIQNYLSIQKYRLRENISFRIEVPDAMLEYDMPKLLLQPLIENAVYHGIEMKGEKGSVEVRAFESEGELHIIVSDDGVGIPETVLAKLIEDLGSQTSGKEQKGYRNIALRNVHARLRLMYGEKYGLKISSRIGEGTTAEICFPVTK